MQFYKVGRRIFPWCSLVSFWFFEANGISIFKKFLDFIFIPQHANLIEDIIETVKYNETILSDYEIDGKIETVCDVVERPPSGNVLMIK